jgi:hypothetical protein
MKIHKDGKSYPKSLDYFYIESFPELINAYGEKPTKFMLMFPSDDITDFYKTEYSKWGSKGGSHIKKRSCNGEECIHHVKESIAGFEFEAGEISPCLCFGEGDVEESQLCSSYTSLMAWIIHPKTGKIISSNFYQFETRSDNSSDNIYTELDKVWHMTGGRLFKVPFILTVNMVETTVAENGDAKKRKFPIWYLQAYGTIEKILDFVSLKTLPTTDETKIELKQIEAPKGDGQADAFKTNKDIA